MHRAVDNGGHSLCRSLRGPGRNKGQAMQDRTCSAALLRQNLFTHLDALKTGFQTVSKRAILGVALAFPSTAFAVGSVNGPHLVLSFEAAPPGGAIDLCMRFKWACSAQRDKTLTPYAMLGLAKKINSNINRKVRQIEDSRQYGLRDFWTLPTDRGGDCEDFALLKKATLIQEGFSPRNLLIATVLDKNSRNHAVLILRTTAGDYVLDSATSEIRLWSKTRYSFLKIQDPNAPNQWRAVLAGGVFG